MKNPRDQKSPFELLQKPPNLSHLKRLTTPLGIVQHAIGSEPDLRFGYSIDDAARALIVCVWYASLFGEKGVRDIAQIYLEHIAQAQLPSGRFHNFKNRDGKFLDKEGSQDSLGRTVWALGIALESGLVDKKTVGDILARAELHLRSLRYPRSVAFSLLGMVHAGNKPQDHDLTQHLVDWYQKHSIKDWHWFEDCARYSNGILPYALITSGEATGREIGLTSLQFLNTVSRVDGIPSPIGNKGWFCRSKKRAIYDQQCIDATDMVLANLAAYESTGDSGHLQESLDWFQWFHGNNLKNAQLVTKDGGCYDGINGDRINTHQGAESVLAYLLAYLALAEHARLNGKGLQA